MDLLVLAAGMGSRFGGLKQIEAVGPTGEFILDYSIYDAKKAGFEKIIFVIKRENLEIFESTIGNRIKDKIKVEYAFQDIEDIPVSFPKGRVKPWGTVQAILCAKDKITNNFAVINADDFYGREAYFNAKELLSELNGNVHGAVLYKAKNTLSENGKVKRGICEVDDEFIYSIDECEVYKENEDLICEPLYKSFDSYKASLEKLVSMNMFLFNTSIFGELESYFNNFFRTSKDLLKDECLISAFVDEVIKNEKIQMTYKATNSKWYGITYKEDLPSLKDGINGLINLDEYNEDLWG